MANKLVCRAIWLIKETTLEICWDDSPRRLTFFAVPATVSRRLRIFRTVRSIANPPVSAVVEAVRATAAAEEPEDPSARHGRLVAERLGCFRCHGPGGRGAGSNPGSLKGYIPSWDGRDFEELVANARELREWIVNGRPQRLQANPVARFFLDRQAIRMPAFRDQVNDEDLQAIEAYIAWLRSARR